mgnify:CR=1 FL=1
MYSFLYIISQFIWFMFFTTRTHNKVIITKYLSLHPLSYPSTHGNKLLFSRTYCINYIAYICQSQCLMPTCKPLSMYIKCSMHLHARISTMYNSSQQCNGLWVCSLWLVAFPVKSHSQHFR